MLVELRIAITGRSTGDQNQMMATASGVLESSSGCSFTGKCGVGENSSSYLIICALCYRYILGGMNCKEVRGNLGDSEYIILIAGEIHICKHQNSSKCKLQIRALSYTLIISQKAIKTLQHTTIYIVSRNVISAKHHPLECY